jgi:hypothetical protein
MPTIEVDTVVDGEWTIDDWIFHLEHLYPVAVHVAREFGPAGGNPVLAIEGDERYLRRVLVEQYDVDEDELAELYGL